MLNPPDLSGEPFIPWKANNFTASSAFFSAKLFNSIAYSISSVSIFDV